LTPSTASVPPVFSCFIRSEFDTFMSSGCVGFEGGTRGCQRGSLSSPVLCIIPLPFECLQGGCTIFKQGLEEPVVVGSQASRGATCDEGCQSLHRHSKLPGEFARRPKCCASTISMMRSRHRIFALANGTHLAAASGPHPLLDVLLLPMGAQVGLGEVAARASKGIGLGQKQCVAWWGD
jgi:hypothetical protein